MLTDAEAAELDAPMAEASLEIPTPSLVALPEDAWLRRRLLGFGASEVGALLLALGMPPPEGTPRYVLDAARRLFRVKARLAKAGAAGRAAAGGQARERAVLRAWVEAGCPGADVDPASVRHADDVPREWWPLVDRECPRLTCTPDGWARDLFGDLVHVEVKTTWAAHRDGGLPWHHASQCMAGMAVTGARWSVVVTALGAADERKAPPWEMAVDTVDRDEGEIELLREAARDGWRRVERLTRGIAP